MGAVIAIGEYTVSVCKHGGYWIGHDGGEGMQVSKESLENLIKKFWEENF